MLMGISAGNGKLLKRSLGISTIRDLAEMKFVKVAKKIDYKEKLIKNYQETPLIELPESPVYALQGVSVRDAGHLKKAFGIETIQDFANLKYFHWAKEITEAAEKGGDIDRELFKDRLLKKYETQDISKLLKAPVYSLQGLSKNDSELIYRAFKVKTIKNFAELKYWKWACGIMELYMSETEEPEQPAEKKGQSVWLKFILFAAIIFILLCLIYLLSPGRIAEKIKTFTGGGIESDGESVKGTGETLTAIEERDESSPEIELTEIRKDYYIVQPGDSLVTISKKLFGTYREWPSIYSANRGIISNPKLVYPGQQLKIPEIMSKKE
jgi:hypothetical protein